MATPFVVSSYMEAKEERGVPKGEKHEMMMKGWTQKKHRPFGK